MSADNPVKVDGTANLSAASPFFRLSAKSVNGSSSHINGAMMLEEKDESVGQEEGPLSSGSNVIRDETATRPQLAQVSNTPRADPQPSSTFFLTSAMWVSRTQTRTQELCKYFSIPSTEPLLDEFHCALRKKVLLQGRMFIFDHYITFSSNLFGYVRRRVINFQDVVAVNKKTHFRLPNTIEIEDNRGNKEFFTSFLSRDDAFRLITNCWSQAKPNPSSVSPNPIDRSVQKYGGSMQPELAEAGGCGGAEGLEPHHEEHQPSMATLRSANQDRPGSSSTLMPRRSKTRSLGGTGDNFDFEDDTFDEGEELDAVWDLVESTPLPPIHTGARVIISTVLPGTPKDFFDVLLSNNSSTLEDFLESQGNRRINLAAWKRSEQMGHVRDVQFTAPIKGAFGAWGVPTTQCYQTHRFCQYSEGRLVFESSQTMTDIPYGDCFTVDLRWDVRPSDENGAPVPSVSSSAGGRGTVPLPGMPGTASFMGPGPSASVLTSGVPMLKVEVSLRVPFSRKCLFKRVIESGTNKQIVETYTTFFQLLQVAMQEKVTERMRSTVPLNLESPSTSTRVTQPPGGIEGLVGSASLMSRTTSVLAHVHKWAADGQQADCLRASASSEVGLSVLSPRGSLSGMLRTIRPSMPGNSSQQQQQAQGGNAAMSVIRSAVIGVFRLVGGVIDRASSLVLSVSHSTAAEQRSLISVAVLLLFLLQCGMLLCQLRGSGGIRGPSAAGDSAPAYSQGVPAGSSSNHMPLLENERAFWSQRLQLLSSELTFLQRRMEAVAGEIGSALQHLQIAASPAAGTADMPIVQEL